MSVRYCLLDNCFSSYELLSFLAQSLLSASKYHSCPFNFTADNQAISFGYGLANIFSSKIFTLTIN